MTNPVITNTLNRCRICCDITLRACRDAVEEYMRGDVSGFRRGLGAAVICAQTCSDVIGAIHEALRLEFSPGVEPGVQLLELPHWFRICARDMEFCAHQAASVTDQWPLCGDCADVCRESAVILRSAAHELEAFIRSLVTVPTPDRLPNSVAR